MGHAVSLAGNHWHPEGPACRVRAHRHPCRLCPREGQRRQVSIRESSLGIVKPMVVNRLSIRIAALARIQRYRVSEFYVNLDRFSSAFTVHDGDWVVIGMLEV